MQISNIIDVHVQSLWQFIFRNITTSSKIDLSTQNAVHWVKFLQQIFKTLFQAVLATYFSTWRPKSQISPKPSWHLDFRTLIKGLSDFELAIICCIALTSKSFLLNEDSITGKKAALTYSFQYRDTWGWYGQYNRHQTSARLNLPAVMAYHYCLSFICSNRQMIVPFKELKLSLKLHQD